MPLIAIPTQADVSLWLAKWGLKIIIAFVALLAAFVSGFTLEKRFAATRYAQLELKHAKELAAASEAARKKQTELQMAVDTARGDLDVQKALVASRDAALARVHADNAGLRDAIAAYAGTAAVSKAACDERAAALGRLAAEGVELLGEVAGEASVVLRQCAADHDLRAAEVRALLRSWPK